jgi:hypothetical protein
MTNTPEKLADLNQKIEDEERRYESLYKEEDEEEVGNVSHEHQERLKMFQSYLFSNNNVGNLTTDDLLNKIVGIIDGSKVEVKEAVSENTKEQDEEEGGKNKKTQELENTNNSENNTGNKKFEYYYKGVKYQSTEPLHIEEDYDSYESD